MHNQGCFNEIQLFLIKIWSARKALIKFQPLLSRLLNIKEDFHVHTSYNDHSALDLNVASAVNYAEAIGLKTLAFTEHVRRESNWIDSYVNEIEKINTNSNLKLITGFEAKILKDGSIDCLPKYSDNYFVIASFHTIYGNKEIWMNAIKNVIQNPDVNVIGHLAPEQSFSLHNEELIEICELLREHGKIIELNAKYIRPPLDWVLKFKEHNVEFHLGSDAHSLHEIGEFSRIRKLVQVVNSES
jgi:putative hydrolase